MLKLKNRISVTVESGESYLVIKAKPMQFGEAGLSPMVRLATPGADLSGKDTEVADAAFSLMRKVLSRFMVSPRFWEGHPGDMPTNEGAPKWVSFEDLGDDAVTLYKAITGSSEAEADAKEAATFREDARGESVP